MSTLFSSIPTLFFSIPVSFFSRIFVLCSKRKEVINIGKSEQEPANLTITSNGTPDIFALDAEQYSTLIAHFSGQIYSYISQYYKRKKYTKKETNR